MWKIKFIDVDEIIETIKHPFSLKNRAINVTNNYPNRECKKLVKEAKKFIMWAAKDGVNESTICSTNVSDEKLNQECLCLKKNIDIPFTVTREKYHNNFTFKW